MNLYSRDLALFPSSKIIYALRFIILLSLALQFFSCEKEEPIKYVKSEITQQSDLSDLLSKPIVNPNLIRVQQEVDSRSFSYEKAASALLELDAEYPFID